jgi:hypothetical protein
MMKKADLTIMAFVVTLAAVFSSFTLWLLESWIKYPLFLFGILTIIVLYLIVSGYDIKTTMKQTRIGNLNIGLTIDLFLMASALSLLMFSVLHVDGGLVQLALALLCTSFLSGYALLNIFGLTHHFSKLENLVLSYILSYTFTGFITFVSLPINQDIRTLGVLTSFIVLGLISAFKHKRSKLSSYPKSFSKNIDFLALLIAVTFYVISFYFTYPGFALLPGTDISRHYSHSVVLWRTPELYSAFQYLLSHLHESAFITLSNASVTYIQTALVTLNLMMPLAFYVMAKSYLESIDTRLPTISTIFYSTFSGFAWIYLTKLKLEGVGGSQLSLLSMVNDKADNGAMYVAQPFLWYVPLSVSFTILITQFMFLRKFDLNKRDFVALFSLLIVASYLTHVTEAVIFTLFLCFYAFFSRNKDARIDDALLACIFGFVFLNAFYLILQYLFGISLGFFSLSLILPTLVSILVYVFRRTTVHGKVAACLHKLAVRPLIKAVVYVTAFAYILGLVVWIGGVPSFHTWAINEVAPIVWFCYPVFLGVIGILTIASFYYLLEDTKAKELLMLFIALIVFSFIFGKMMTFINVNFFWAGYREGRFSSYYLLASAILAPMALVKVLNGFNKKQGSLLKIVISASLISIITMCGIQSSFMVVEYWNSGASPSNLPTKEEFEALNILKKVHQNDPYAFGLTLASDSMLTFAAPPYIGSTPQGFYTARNPEVPITELKAHNLSHPYLYMAKRDFQLLNRYSDSWLARHLLPMLPVIYRNNEVTIYNVSSVSFPQVNSTTALLIPFDESLDPEEPWLYAYDMLSLGKYSYTVAYDLDPKIFSYETLMVPVDPPEGNILRRSFEDNFTQWGGWTAVSGTWVYKTDGLHAGKLGEYENAVILSPISAQNFTVSLSFKLLDGNLKVANYVSIVYDWRDKDNFKYTGLMFDSSGIYAYICSRENGNTTQYPPWPGLNTGLRWHLGDSFNLTVSINRNTATLCINGTDYLTAQSIAGGGRIGISMDRFYQVLFTKFKAEAFSLIQDRNPAEYLDYVQNGGNLIVLNTNGYGYFANEMLKADGSTIKVDTIISDSEKTTLPLELTVPKLLPKMEDVEATSYYRSQQSISIYAVKERIGSGVITYVNVYPIMKAIGSSENRSMFYETLGRLLSCADIRLEPFRYTFPDTTAFRQVKMSGNIEVNAPSMLFPLCVNLGKVEITYGNHSIASLENVTGIETLNGGNIVIVASNLTLSDGKGFYSTLTFEGKVVIRYEDNNASIILSTANGDITKISDIDRITIGSDDGSVMLYARQPSIRVQGMASFKELYSSGAIYQRTQTLGQDLSINGTVKLNIYLSDVYTWASSLDASGSFQRSPPLLQYDELTSLPQALFWSLILTPIFLALAFIRKRER